MLFMPVYCVCMHVCACLIICLQNKQCIPPPTPVSTPLCVRVKKIALTREAMRRHTQTHGRTCFISDSVVWVCTSLPSLGAPSPLNWIANSAPSPAEGFQTRTAEQELLVAWRKTLHLVCLCNHAAIHHLSWGDMARKEYGQHSRPFSQLRDMFEDQLPVIPMQALLSSHDVGFFYKKSVNKRSEYTLLSFATP